VAQEWIDEMWAQIKESNEAQARAQNLIQQRYHDFVQVLFMGGLDMIAALVEVCESEEVVISLINLAATQGRHLALLVHLINRVIKATEVETTLFRTDSMTTKAARGYMQVVGGDYLRTMLSPLITAILQDPVGFEIDPNKINSAEDIAENLKKLKAATSKFLDQILKSKDSCPMSLREFLWMAATEVGQKFPASRRQVVAGFYFLRFVCPAIFSPEKFGLAKGNIPAVGQRSLILIAKILQNLANGVQFGAKEAYIQPANFFITDHLKDLGDFMEQLSDIPAPLRRDYNQAMPVSLSQDQQKKAMALVLQSVKTQLPKLEERLSEHHADKITKLKDLMKDLD